MGSGDTGSLSGISPEPVTALLLPPSYTEMFKGERQRTVWEERSLSIYDGCSTRSELARNGLLRLLSQGRSKNTLTLLFALSYSDGVHESERLFVNPNNSLSPAIFCPCLPPSLSAHTLASLLLLL
jgi:hypothetical protein